MESFFRDYNGFPDTLRRPGFVSESITLLAGKSFPRDILTFSVSLTIWVVQRATIVFIFNQWKVREPSPFSIKFMQNYGLHKMAAIFARYFKDGEKHKEAKFTRCGLGDHRNVTSRL